MKKIGIDARLYSQTGVGVYIRNLLYYLQKSDSYGIEFYIYMMKKDFDTVDFEKSNFKKRLANYHWHGFTEQINYAERLYQDNLDLMHFTYFSYPVIYSRTSIATVHDITPLIFKTGLASTKNDLIYSLKHMVFKFVLNRQVKHTKMIITPTSTVKNQLIKIYGHSYADKIHPVYEGVDYQLRLTKENGQLADKFKPPFFIYVGNFYPHKNVENLIKAIAGVTVESKLVLIGPNDYFAKRLIKLVNNLKLNNRIIFYANPTREDLVFFYRHAKALIHPSLSEGFGLPIAEAVNFNLPIIASNIDVFRELLGYQYLSFNPTQISDISTKINDFINHQFVYDYQSIISKFSFNKMSTDTLNIYLRCLNDDQSSK